MPQPGVGVGGSGVGGGDGGSSGSSGSSGVPPPEGATYPHSLFSEALKVHGAPPLSIHSSLL